MTKRNNFKDVKEYTITLKHHVLFWLTYFALNTFRWGSYFDDYAYSLKTNLLGFPIHIFLTYLNIFYLMPRFLYRRKYIQYLILLFSAIFLMVVAKFNLTYYLVSTNVWPEGPRIIHNFDLNYAIDMMIGELYVITFVTAIKITIDWIKEHKRLADVEKEQLETKLLFLRSQISPHFFFNTLNNIYSLSIDKSNKTPQVVLKLSELMRYMLYETKQRRQLLENEIICIQNYLDLERIRHGDHLTIDLTITGDISGKKIAPMLLLSFIENAFKHGVNKNIGKTKVSIDFNIIDEFLYFAVTNPNPKKTNHKQRFNKAGGIGLKNVQNRLKLGYKEEEEYKLDIINTGSHYIVKLKIKLDED